MHGVNRSTHTSSSDLDERCSFLVGGVVGGRKANKQQHTKRHPYNTFFIISLFILLDSRSAVHDISGRSTDAISFFPLAVDRQTQRAVAARNQNHRVVHSNKRYHLHPCAVQIARWSRPAIRNRKNLIETIERSQIVRFTSKQSSNLSSCPFSLPLFKW